MTKIIPRDLIKHLEWVPGQQTPQKPVVNPTPTPQPVQQRTSSIDALIKNGKEFYSEQKDGKGNYIGVAIALQEAYDQMGSDGIIATLPYLIAGKAQADKRSYLWQKWFTGLSEENAGIDKNGSLVSRGNGIILSLHGGGILTADRIRQAYSEGLTPQNAAKFTDDEFDNLLRGVLPNGESINLYTVDDIVKGNIPDPFGRYAVWMPAETAKGTNSGYHKKKGFMENPLVIARAGTLEHLEKYFDKAKDSDGDVGCYHKFGEIDFRQPQGRVLFVDGYYFGLRGDIDLDNNGRFVGVAPEAPGARKK
jgi:hypothetical protein